MEEQRRDPGEILCETEPDGIAGQEIARVWPRGK